MMVTGVDKGRQRRVSRPQVALSAALLALALVVLSGVDLHALVRFWRWYAARFVAYYAPKLALVKRALRQLPELPEEVYDAWDVSIALIVMVSVFHLLERLRLALLATVQPTPPVECR